MGKITYCEYCELCDKGVNQEKWNDHVQLSEHIKMVDARMKMKKQ